MFLLLFSQFSLEHSLQVRLTNLDLIWVKLRKRGQLYSLLLSNNQKLMQLTKIKKQLILIFLLSKEKLSSRMYGLDILLGEMNGYLKTLI